MTFLRSLTWALSAPLRLALIALIKVYRLTLSGYLGNQCRFYPSCSHYAEAAIRDHGALRGILMAAWRILRCGPFTTGGVDHVPPSPRERARAYDSVIRRAREAAS